jgi:hypothetical protein
MTKMRLISGEASMHDAPTSCDAGMHPAMRKRVLQVSADSRLKFLALSRVGAAKLDNTLACLESLTSPRFLSLGAPHYRLVGTTAEALRRFRGRLVDWENGDVPTLAEASALVHGLTCCQHLLVEWVSLLEGHTQIEGIEVADPLP